MSWWAFGKFGETVSPGVFCNPYEQSVMLTHNCSQPFTIYSVWMEVEYWPTLRAMLRALPKMVWERWQET